MYIHVKVHANAKNESWVSKKPDHFEAFVREKAENNQANTRVLSMVAEHFNTPVNHVRIVNGHHSPSKLISVSE